MGYIRKPYGRVPYARSPYLRAPYGAGQDRDGLVFEAPLLTSTDEVFGAVASFTRASTATYIGSDGLLKTAAINEPRFEFDGGGGALGYLSEGQRTNYAVRSEESDNPIWNKTNITVIANDGTAPDGTTTADRLTATAANGTIIQNLGTLAAADYTYSVWIERVTGSGAIELTLDNGTTWTAVTVTSSPVRVEITQNLANPDVGIRIVTSGDAIRVWGHDAEDGAFASSYIPTVAATVTRIRDFLEYSPNPLPATLPFSISWEGLGTIGQPALPDARWYESDGGTDRAFSLLDGPGRVRFFVRVGGTTTFVDNSTYFLQPSDNRVTQVLTASAYTLYIDGTQQANVGTNPPAPTTWDAPLAIGAANPGPPGFAQTFGYIRNFKVWNRVLSLGEV